MTVYVIGAGPGAADLITLRGQRLVERCEVCIHAGSLVPEALVRSAPETARVIDSSSLTLEEIVEEMRKAHGRGQDVARLHSGDPSIYGATAEQMRRLDALGIDWEIVPGVPAFAAAAAALGCELTLPGISQTVILSRSGSRASPMPPGEGLEHLAGCSGTLVLHLAVRALREIRRVLEPVRGPDCPVAVVYRASWPDQQIIRGRLDDIGEKVRKAGITRTALIIIGPVVSSTDFSESRLYDKTFRHLTRF